MRIIELENCCTGNPPLRQNSAATAALQWMLGFDPQTDPKTDGDSLARQDAGAPGMTSEDSRRAKDAGSSQKEMLFMRRRAVNIPRSAIPRTWAFISRLAYPHSCGMMRFEAG
jgi:hypothetical protein